MLEWNVVFFHCMINNYAYMHVLVQNIPIFIMCMFMGLVYQIDSIMAVPSSLIGGLEALQIYSKMIYFNLEIIHLNLKS